MKHAITLRPRKNISKKRIDPDNPPWTEDMLGPPLFKRGRGPQKTPTKILTTVRLDADVIAYFRAQGRGYQTRINDELRKVVVEGRATGHTLPRARTARAS